MTQLLVLDFIRLDKTLDEVGCLDLSCTHEFDLLALVDALEPSRVLDLLKRTIFITAVMQERDRANVVRLRELRGLYDGSLLYRYAYKLGLDTLEELKVFVHT